MLKYNLNMLIIMDLFIFIFGTIIGSFLNVVILRYNTGYSPVATRSRCFNCGKILKWYELIPILSFLIQFGRCRNCKSKISIQYPLIELLTGIIFLLIFHFQSQHNHHLDMYLFYNYHNHKLLL